jgi:Tfp pilus assembly PilM family ATPase
MPFLSIELGKHRFKVLLLERTKDALTVRQDLTLTIMPSEDFNARVSETLRDFIYRYDVTDRKVYLAIADPNVLSLRNVVLPALPPNELVPALIWHAKEEGTLTEETTLFNYEIVKEFTGEDGAKKMSVTFSIVNRKLLENSFNVLTRLGLEVLQVTAAPLNTARVLACYGDTEASQVVLDLGYGASTLSIYKKGKLLFVRTLSFSYGKAKLSLSDPFFLGAKYRTPEADAEIEQSILTIGIPREEFAAGGGADRATQFYGLMRPLLEVLVREIRYSLTYFTTNLKEANPVSLFLTGHGTKFRDLDLYLGRELGITVLSLQLPASIHFLQKDGSEDPVHLSQCVSAVAGVIPGASVIDFMPHELKCRKSEAFQRGVLRLATLTLAGILILLFFFVNLRIVAARDQIKIQQKYLQALGAFAKASEQPFERFHLARQLEEGTIPPEKVLRLLGHLIPQELAIRRLMIDPADRTMTMDLETSGVDEGGNPVVADVVRRLRESRFFRSVNVSEVPGYAVSVYRIKGVFSDD